MDLVEAQEARRILDRLYGYEVSPVLWKKVMSGLSAGRVQSVATRLVVDRERERIAFRLASYWDLEGTFDAGSKHEQRMFPAKLHSVDGARVARGSDFGPDGQLKASAATRSSTSTGPGPRRLVDGAARHDVRRPLGRVQALPPLAVRAVPHDHAAAGGQPQARHERLDDDVGGAAAVRERLHHLHAYRLDRRCRRRRSTRPRTRSASCTAPSTSPTRPAPTPPRSRTPRRRTRRSARRATRSAPRRRPG